MGCSDQLLPTISALVALGEFSTGSQPVDVANLQTVSDTLPAAEKQQRAEREWQGAIAALSQLLNQQIVGKMSPKERAKAQKNTRSKSPKALVISGPVPLLNDSSLAPHIASQISNWTLVPQSSEQFASAFSALSPDLSDDLSSSDLSAVKRLFQKTFNKQSFHTRLLPLLKEDPLAQEQFVVVLTAEFSMVLVLGKDADSELRFQFSFMPEVVSSVWRMLRSRIRAVRPQQLEFIDPLVEKFAPKAPHYRIVSQFNRWMLACLPQSANSNNAVLGAVRGAVQSVVHQAVQTENGHHAQQLNSPQTHEMISAASATEAAAGQFSDSALLKAMAHEIRTPLTTIRTYTRSLLKRENMDPQVIKRLKSIDRECTQQIDRFSLIFRAVELEAASQTAKSPLSAMALHQVFQEAIPQWQQAAQRRNLSLEVGLPPELPMVASDPTMLQHVLTGLVELFTHSVSPGSHIQLHVLHAGEQLKLQFQSQADPSKPNTAPACPPPPLQSLGHLLMFQPETGGLSLNLKATKNLFHALGAKLTVRERSNQGTTWTVFLPLEASGLKSYPIV